MEGSSVAWRSNLRVVFGLIGEEVPHIIGEGRVNTCKDRKKVGLKRFYGTFDGVSAMDI